MESERDSRAFMGATQPDIVNEFRVINGITGGLKRFNTSGKLLNKVNDVVSVTLSPERSAKKDGARARAAKSQLRRGESVNLTPRQPEFEDRTFRRTGMSVGLVAGTEKTNPFGHSFYRSPIADTRYKIAFGHSVDNQKHKNFTDRIATRLGYVPGPKYMEL